MYTPTFCYNKYNVDADSSVKSALFILWFNCDFFVLNYNYKTSELFSKSKYIFIFCIDLQLAQSMK